MLAAGSAGCPDGFEEVNVQGNENVEIVLSPSTLRRVLAGVTAAVSLAGLTVEVLKSIYRWKGRGGIVPLLSLSHEQNVPTLYTAILLLVAASLSAMLAARARRVERRDLLPWWGLAAGFFYIAVDEVVELHEQWGRSFRLGGVLHFGWVVPASAIVLALAVLYSRFLLRLPAGLRNRLVLAGAVYVLGAVGMELPLGYWAEKEGEKTLGYALIDWVEETMEMAGIALFVAAAFDALAAAGVRVRFGGNAPAPEIEAPAGPEKGSP
jgi:hypothetical protein